MTCAFRACFRLYYRYRYRYQRFGLFDSVTVMIVFVIVIQVILALSCETLLVSISNTSTYHIICPSHVRSTNHDTFTLHAPISYQVVQNWRPVFHDCPAFDTYHNYEANMYPGWQWTPNPVEHVVELEEDCCSIAT